ncbi:murein hydrolase activator EnvC family protein [Sunxiuqinia sp. A32]|uniref:murein hydrolase activator EnvC family protein n=1 Tax=Sunxiuqinia sp. A32 TaxID=3461496 RepID=UPI00404647D7
MKSTFLFALLILWGMSLKGQSLNELRARKINTSQVIKYTSTLLQEAQKNEKASIGKLRLINSQISNRNRLIGDINEEIDALDYYIDENAEMVAMIREDLLKLKDEYAGMIRFAQKNKNTYDKLIFLFSSENINQAYKRMIYLQQYSKYRKSQTELMVNLADLLDKKVIALSKKKEQKEQLLADKESENMKLLSEKDQQSQYISSLQKRQQDLRKKLRQQEKEQEKLNKEIERIVEEQARKAREKSGFELTPEQKLIAADFEKNKGRLPWPVDRGVITEKFGVHSHPVLKQVQIKNNGIDITTTKNSKARAVFNGEVSRVFAISGGNMAVIIRHGTFLSVYSNLQEVFVKPGDAVETKQEIGSIYSDKNDGDKTILKFQVWQENQKQNPELWISR